VSFQVAGFQTEGYLIDTEVYQGPLDLLLELIEKAELDITRLALAQVTDQYLDYMHRLQLENPAEVSAFLVIASRLLQIKSQALLPRPSDSSAYEDEQDPGEALARQLILYKRFKEVALLLSEREAEGLRTYLRMAPPLKINIQPKLDISELTLDQLIQAAKDILQSKPELAELNSVVSMPRITIRDRIQSILNRLHNVKNTSFQLLLNNKSSRVEIVVTFLALLELVKRHVLTATQESIFGSIELSKEDNIEVNLDEELEFEE
jgi:segregation and condensation protein A